MSTSKATRVVDLRDGDVARFDAKRTRGGASACWIWRAQRSAKGYGRFRFAGRMQQAHRVALAIAGVDVPAGMDVDHLCRRRECTNPAHLEVVSSATNTARGEPAGRTACPQGHAYTPENTRRRGGRRYCRRCNGWRG